MAADEPLILRPDGRFENYEHEADAAEDVLPGWAIDDIVAAGLRMDRFGWVQGSAGNLSLRLSETRIAITRAGRHKGELEAADIMLVDRNGVTIDPDLRPTVETPLHCRIYDALPHVGAVVHGHSIPATVMTLATTSSVLTLSGYEALKAFGGGSAALDLPIIENGDIGAQLAAEGLLLAAGAPLGFAVRGHGAYAWGPDMKSALARLEALEFMLSCELESRTLKQNS